MPRDYFEMTRVCVIFLFGLIGLLSLAIQAETGVDRVHRTRMAQISIEGVDAPTTREMRLASRATRNKGYLTCTRRTTLPRSRRIRSLCWVRSGRVKCPDDRRFDCYGRAHPLFQDGGEERRLL